MIRNILKRRILIAILMASMVLGVAFLTAFTCPASARGCVTVTTTYYSDATKTTAIGGRYKPCEGPDQWWGSTSTFHSTIYNFDECGC